MPYDPRAMLNEFTEGLKDVGKTNPAVVKSFFGLLGEDYKSGAVDTKTKELISVGIAAYCRCEYCIVYHVYKAYEAGATKEEIMESSLIAVAFGGGPSMTYVVNLLKASAEEFENDFVK